MRYALLNIRLIVKTISFVNYNINYTTILVRQDLFNISQCVTHY